MFKNWLGWGARKSFTQSYAEERRVTQRRPNVRLAYRGEATVHGNEISREIVDAAYKVHRRIRPGLFESVYERILRYELESRGLVVVTQHPVPVIYDSVQIDDAFRADLIVQEKVIVELKSVEAILPIHKRQLLTYLR